MADASARVVKIRVGTGMVTYRRKLMAYLNTRPGEGFTAKELQRATGVSMRFVRRALKQEPDVVILWVNHRRRYGIKER